MRLRSSAHPSNQPASQPASFSVNSLLDQWGSSVDKGAFCASPHGKLSLSPGTHIKVERENWLHRFVLWCPHVCYRFCPIPVPTMNFKFTERLCSISVFQFIFKKKDLLNQSILSRAILLYLSVFVCVHVYMHLSEDPGQLLVFLLQESSALFFS